MTLQIGKLAHDTNETVKTLRFWTSLGLLRAERGMNRYRYYSPDAVDRVKFIRNTQALGFSLRETRDILELRDRNELPCQEVRERLAEHLTNLRARIDQLRRLEDELSARLAWAKAHPNPECYGDGCIYLGESPGARRGNAASHHSLDSPL